MAITGKVLYNEFNEVFTEGEKLRSVTLKENLSDDEIENFLDGMTAFCELCIKKTRAQLNSFQKQQKKAAKEIER